MPIIAISLIAGGMFTSCDQDKEHCWTITYKVMGGSASETFWGTAEQCDIEIAHERAEIASDANISIKEVRVTRRINKQYKSRLDCNKSPINDL